MVATRTVSVIGKSGDKKVLSFIKSEPFKQVALGGSVVNWAASVFDVQIFDDEIHVLYIKDGKVSRESFLQTGTPAGLGRPDPIMEFRKDDYMVKSMTFGGNPSKLSIDLVEPLRVKRR